jgi:PAT family acetyl-CoA transporter-like MFS transporter 1
MKYKIIPVDFNDLIKQDNLTVSIIKKEKKKSAESSSLGRRRSSSSSSSSSSSFQKDAHNILFLGFLYFLQGIPLGLKASLPYILTSRQASYTSQALFSLASWPFSLKLLWAPIVDSVFVKHIGRRKSWLVPVQYLIGIFMLFFADYVHDILERKESISGEDINILTGIFFLFTFLSATQDIAVDGWGLTILSK